MREREDEFEELLDEILKQRANAPVPLGMETRALRRMEESVAAWSWSLRRMTPVLAAAVVLLVVAGAVSYFHVAQRTAPKVASVESPRPLRGAVGASRQTAANAVSVRLAAPTPRGTSRIRLVKLRSEPTVREQRDEERPKLDIFPSTAIDSSAPAPGSMEAQLRMLTSLPQESLEVVAQAQAKDEEDVRKRTGSLPN